MRTALRSTWISKRLARVQARLEIIPQEAADEIVKNCTIDKIDMAKLRQQTERIGYPVLGVVSQLNALCRDKLGEYCHWGATTQDITDTATVLQIREALKIVEDDLAALSAGLADLARRHRDTPMIGRSNLQQPFPSPSAIRWPDCWPPWSGIATGWTSCARACWWVNSPEPLERWPRSSAAPWRRRKA